MDNRIVIDCGNTYIKIGLFNHQQLIQLQKIKTNSCLQDWLPLNSLLQNKPIFLGTSCPKKTQSFVDWIKNNFPNQFYLFQKSDFKELDFDAKIQQDEVSLDILAFATYLKTIDHSTLGFCFGTGYFSLHIVENKICSCSIINNILSSFYQLCSKTDLISLDVLKHQENQQLIGYDTKSAIGVGMSQLCNGFINQNIIQYQSISQGKMPTKIIIAGGDCHAFSYTIDNLQIEQNAVLFGYNWIAEKKLS